MSLLNDSPDQHQLELTKLGLTLFAYRLFYMKRFVRITKVTHITKDMDSFVLSINKGSDRELSKAIGIIFDAFNPLIMGCIRKYPTFDRSTLENVSREAIWQSILKFDSTKGNFSNYLSRSIKLAIANEVSGSNGIVYVPDEVRSNIRKVDRVIEEFEKKGLNVTIEDIMDATGLGRKAVVRALETSITVQNVASLDSPLSSSEEESLKLGDTVSDPDGKIEIDYYSEVMRDLEKALDTLPERERIVYTMKKGIKREGAKNREIMEVLGISEPTAISIFKKAEKKVQAFMAPLYNV